MAKALRELNDNWVGQMELIAYQAKRARVMYIELKKQGFTDSEALILCKP